jgi:hypothetical protein
MEEMNEEFKMMKIIMKNRIMKLSLDMMNQTKRASLISSGKIG